MINLTPTPMFTVYHSNDLYAQKDMLIKVMQLAKPQEVFQPDIILVQSPGMAQWLQLQIAQQYGIAANLQFPMPASFIWQQYQQTLPEVAEQRQFNKEALTWQLMALLQQEDFPLLQQYIQFASAADQGKAYQLAKQLADLFDQYLVYRPEWILAWERGDDEWVARAILAHNPSCAAPISQHIQWQGALWRALSQRIKQQQGQALLHRANLHQDYLAYLAQKRPACLPQHLFIFGIAALPQTYLATFEAMSQHCHIHLFFNNPCRYYWGDIVDPSYLQRLKLKNRQGYQQAAPAPLFSAQQAALVEQLQQAPNGAEQQLIGNPLLASWGKLGRDFLYSLTEMENNEIAAFIDPSPPHSLLQQLQQGILNLSDKPFDFAPDDQSLLIQACHSPMREVEVLHDHLLYLFQQDPKLTPRDIVVMVADIDHYAPYISAVFGQYRQDKRFIPFSLSDRRLTENDVLVAGLLSLLRLKESQFSAEQLLDLLDIPAIHQRFGIEASELEKIRYWVKQAGIRFGLTAYDGLQQASSEQNQTPPNYNSWQKGLERMLLGQAMRAEQGIWQDSLGFDPSYGLKAAVVGSLMAFIQRLTQWVQCLAKPHAIHQWQQHLTALIDDFFALEKSNQPTLLYLQQSVTELAHLLSECQYDKPIDIEVIADALTDKLQQTQHSLHFLVGKVSFCTLLPMRAIPFKVICLLGMNDGDYPRQQPRNSFDLMQYHQQKGDRLRREDDRYLFLEALLSARQQFYLSYVGRSILDNQPKEPSVLVNQLLDYIGENSANSENGEKLDIRQRLVRLQPMQLFNPKNSAKNHRSLSFASQWQALSNPAKTPIAPFAQPLQPNSAPSQEPIELGQLVAFVVNPVKFFFEQRLGVYFKQTDQSIAEQENFTLDKLAQFTIHQHLLTQPESLWSAYFQQLKVGGVLPKAHFGELQSLAMQEEVSQFKQTIAAYLEQTPQQQFVRLDLGALCIEGNINRLYGEQKQRVAWRLGRVRDQDRIENWIYYLMLQAQSELPIAPPIFYGTNGKPEQPPALSPSEARAQLQVYAEAYERSNQHLVLIPTQYLTEYHKLLTAPGAVNLAQCEQYLRQIAQGADFGASRPDPYWARVLAQTPKLDLATINQAFLNWFGTMLDK